MRKLRYFTVALLICGAASLVNSVPMAGQQTAWGDEPIVDIRPDPRAAVAELDVAKGRIEKPLKRALVLQQAVEAPAVQPEPKTNIEKPVVEKPPVEKPADRGKAIIELGAKRLVQLSAEELQAKLTAVVNQAKPAVSTGGDAKPSNDATRETPFSKERIVDSDSENPRVEPGKVHWHDDFAAACQASRQSGKPVLLFQLLGQLDQRFT